MIVHGFRQWRRQWGFSLLEALVALAIAAIAFGALYRVVGQSSFSTNALDDRVQAHVLARSIFASVTFADQLMQHPSGFEGDWQWTVQVTPEMLTLTTTTGQPQTLQVQGGRINLSIARAGRQVLTWTAWKPMGPGA